MSDERNGHAINALGRAARFRGIVRPSDNDLLAWAATRTDEELLDIRGFGALSLAWVRAQHPVSPWVAGELEHFVADFLSVLPATWSWRLASPQHGIGWALVLLNEEGMAFTKSEFRGPTLVSVFRAAGQAHGGA